MCVPLLAAAPAAASAAGATAATAANAAMIMSIVSASVAAAGALYGGIQQHKLAGAQAKLYGAQAEAARARGESEAFVAGMSARQQIGQQIVDVGASGVVGGGERVIQASRFGAGYDQAMIRYNASLDAYDARAQASISRWQGRQARVAGGLSALGSALSGASSVVNTYRSGLSAGLVPKGQQSFSIPWRPPAGR